MYAEFTGFVGSSGNHAPFISLTTDNDRLAFQGWIEQFFDGDEEGVHVNVEDGLGGRAHRSHTTIGCACNCRTRSYTRTYSRAESFHEKSFAIPVRISRCQESWSRYTCIA